MDCALEEVAEMNRDGLEEAMSQLNAAGAHVRDCGGSCLILTYEAESNDPMIHHAGLLKMAKQAVEQLSA